ncbi:MAG: Tn3 family transposase [Pseudomonadales bacterium]|nr:Tn3 family transposase [Pseudomonadales bacterium]
MVAVYQTAYPRIKEGISEKDLDNVYTPTSSEKRFASKHCQRQSAAHLGFLIQLKMVQRLGRFSTHKEIPDVIIKYISASTKSRVTTKQLTKYFSSGAKDRHIKLLRKHLGIKPYDKEKTAALAKSWSEEVAVAKEELADIINVVIERLIKNNFELPAYYEIHRVAQSGRARANNQLYNNLCALLDAPSKQLIKNLLVSSTGQSNGFGWDSLKSEPKKPTPRNIKEFVTYLKWFKVLQDVLPVNLGLPPTKHLQFINEAKAIDYSDLMKLKANKRNALVIILVRHHYAQTLDHAADILIKIINKIDRTATVHLEKYLIEHRKQTDQLIGILSETMRAYLNEDDKEKALDNVIGNKGGAILSMCEKYMTFANNNYLPFMLPLYKKNRTSLFNTIEILDLESASEDDNIIKAIKFIVEHKKRRSDTLSIVKDESAVSLKYLVNIRWISEKWWKLVTGKTSKSAKVTHINKHYFELCVFVRVAEELKNGDIFIPYSEKFDDYRETTITDEEYEDQLDTYCDEVGLVAGAAEFTEHLKNEMLAICHTADERFPEDDDIRFDSGRLVVSRQKADEPPKRIKEIDLILKDRMSKLSLLDVIIDVEKWMGLSSTFGPLSGLESKIDDSVKRFILTIFCYGTNIGPTETVRSVKGISRKQMAWLNLKRVTEPRLDKTIAKVVNRYKQYDLIKCWGTGESVSADGKLWNLHENNLVSEYHVRYGSYGGIAYYHVSDTYIALFSRFIPCGVYEAIYILDGLLNHDSDFTPDTVHGDTHAQSTPVFGLAYLLGIKLMPRIRHLKDLKFYKPDKDMVLSHLESLFSDPIKWDLIDKYYPDMMKTAMSIKAGKITPSTILRRFGSNNRKNKVYFAFRELGRVVRTMYLLEYITDVEMRKMVQAATCKSEEFNGFADWHFFANSGKISSNLQDQQNKIVKYNHLLANMSILHNVNAMTEIFNDLKSEGYDITLEDMAKTSPYRSEHLGRLGSFGLDLDREVIPARFDLAV